MTPGPGFIRGSKLPQLLVSVLLLGIADSMIGPYLVLFGADEGSSPRCRWASSCRSSLSAGSP